MSDTTITTYEGTVTAESVGTTITVTSGGFGSPGARVVLLAHGVTTPPAGTPVGSLIFQKGA